MSNRSRYDELHDHYHKIRTTKAGTRYERLAAVVFAALERESVVIHDVRVTGSDSGVAHQIDVHLTQNEQVRRVLIECKDFDVSAEPVGLPVVRNFWAVVDDVHPDEAWILACNDFTRDARKFAKAKGIRLATLRLFALSDWEDRIRTVVADVIVERPVPERLHLKIPMADADAASFHRDLAAATSWPAIDLEHDRTQLFDGEATRSLSNIAQSLLDSKHGSGATELTVGKLCDGWVSADGSTRYAIRGFQFTIPISRVGTRITIAAIDGAAKLLLSDGAGLDFVLWDSVLRGYVIDDSGEVHLADDASQQRLNVTVGFSPLAAMTSESADATGGG